MTVPDPHRDDSLLATEGVDEGSKESTAEGATSTEEFTGGQAPLDEVVGQPPSSGPASEADPAPPVDMESDASREARDRQGTGQQLEAGEG